MHLDSYVSFLVKQIDVETIGEVKRGYIDGDDVDMRNAICSSIDIREDTMWII